MGRPALTASDGRVLPRSDIELPLPPIHHIDRDPDSRPPERFPPGVCCLVIAGLASLCWLAIIALVRAYL